MISTKRTTAAQASAPKFHYDVLQSKHIEQALKVIAITFSRGEPMTSYLGISENEFADFAKPLVEKTAACGLGIVALDGDKVAACTSVEDFADQAHIEIEKLSPKFKPILGVLDKLGHTFFEGKRFAKNHLAHLFITAVHPDYQGQGLSKEVNLRSIKNAADKNYDFMCCEFTSAINERGTVKHLENNFKLFTTCVYKDFEFAGMKPFEKLEGRANAYIWALRKGVELRYSNEEKESFAMKI